VSSANTNYEQKVVCPLPPILILAERQSNLKAHNLLFLHLSTPVLSIHTVDIPFLCSSTQAEEENSLQSLISFLGRSQQGG